MDEKYQLMLVDYGVRIITALVIYIVGKWIAKIITGLVKKTMEKRNIDTALVSFAGTGTRVCSLAKRQSSEKNLLILPVNG